MKCMRYNVWAVDSFCQVTSTHQLMADECVSLQNHQTFLDFRSADIHRQTDIFKLASQQAGQLTNWQAISSSSSWQGNDMIISHQVFLSFYWLLAICRSSLSLDYISPENNCAQTTCNAQRLQEEQPYCAVPFKSVSIALTETAKTIFAIQCKWNPGRQTVRGKYVCQSLSLLFTFVLVKIYHFEQWARVVIDAYLLEKNVGQVCPLLSGNSHNYAKRSVDSPNWQVLFASEHVCLH